MEFKHITYRESLYMLARQTTKIYIEGDKSTKLMLSLKIHQ